MSAFTVVIWEDRHCDTTVHLFSDAATAIGWAREQAHEMIRNGTVTQKRYPDGETCIMYGPESDRLRVIPGVNVDGELKEAA